LSETGEKGKVVERKGKVKEKEGEGGKEWDWDAFVCLVSAVKECWLFAVGREAKKEKDP
jgi:hypothetical protein